jgi:hypothetical protein
LPRIGKTTYLQAAIYRPMMPTMPKTKGPAQRRLSVNLTQRQVAEFAAIHQPRLSMHERGVLLLTDAEAARLETVLSDFERSLSRRGPAPFLTEGDRRLRNRAHSLVGRALKAGTLTREPCEVCGATSTVGHHRYGYGRPLDVAWLCGLHHGQEHLAMNRARQERANELRTAEKRAAATEVREQYGLSKREARC